MDLCNFYKLSTAVQTEIDLPLYIKISRLQDFFYPYSAHLLMLVTLKISETTNIKDIQSLFASGGERSQSHLFSINKQLNLVDD